MSLALYTIPLDVSTTAVQQAAAAGVVTSVAMAAIKEMVHNTPPLCNLTPTCQLTFNSPPQQVVNEPPSTELETSCASEFSTFTVQEAWDHGNIARNYQTMSSREEFKLNNLAKSDPPRHLNIHWPLQRNVLLSNSNCCIDTYYPDNFGQLVPSF